MEMITQIEAPIMTMVDHAYQVGAPKYPHGVTMEFEIEWKHNIWTKHDDESLTFVTEKMPKKYRLNIHDDELESLLNQWREGVVNYEEWLLDIKHKHEQFKVDFTYKNRRRWWQIFKSRKAAPSVSA